MKEYTEQELVRREKAKALRESGILVLDLMLHQILKL